MEQNIDTLLPVIQQSLEIVLPENISMDELKQKISESVNHLIQHDFNKLVSILYRMDINEMRLKSLLKENPGGDAGNIIAGMIIDRQVQKIKSRQEYRRDEKNKGEDDW